MIEPTVDQMLKLQALNWSFNQYIPQKAQEPVHVDTHRIKLIAGGEGAGKSLVTAMEMLAYYPLWRLCYIVGPKYQSCYPEFDYLSESLLRMGLVRKSNLSRPTKGPASMITVDGARVETLSSEDGPKSITGTGESPDLIAMVEAGKQTYDIFLACRGRVARSRGRLIISGTFESSLDWYAEFYERWRIENTEGARSFSIPTWTNLALYPKGKDDPEIQALQATYPPEKFMERFGAIPAPPHTIVFPEFSYLNHVQPTPYWQATPFINRPVELAVDPGYFPGAYAVLAIQRQDDQVYVIDEVYLHRKFAGDVIAECETRPWWKQVKGGVCDQAGLQHQGLPSHVEIWQNEARVFLRTNYVLIEDGIHRTRTFLKSPWDQKPRITIDPRCTNLIWEFGRYRYREDKDGRPQTDTPVDRDNHALKALGYWLVDVFLHADQSMNRLRRKDLNQPFLERLLRKAFAS